VKLRRTQQLAAVAAVGLMLGLALSIGAASAARSARTAADNSYVVHNLVSDGFAPADHIDPFLVNGWGIAAAPTSPWWVAANGTDYSTIYRGDGTIVPFRVAVAGGPTGIVFNYTHSSFVLHKRGRSEQAIFLFASEDGRIRGWNPDVSSETAVVAASHRGAIYKGLAIGTTAGGHFLYAADFHHARVDVFGADFDRVRMPGAFRDPAVPPRYAPFGIQNLNGRIFVTYAQQDEEREDEVTGPGKGIVDVYDTSGTLLAHVAVRTHALNAPWGLAWAPNDFGAFSGDLLVGNFGDGRINAYHEEMDGSFVYDGKLRNPDRSPVEIDGLWGIGFGNGDASGSTTSLYFAAGPDDQEHSLFGVISASSAGAGASGYK
jgi:uncharacterized protein (TIGR03118 family)